jgi:hypothetical protein
MTPQAPRENNTEENMSFTPSVDKKTADQVVATYTKIFEEEVLKGLKLAEIRKVITVPVPEKNSGIVMLLGEQKRPSAPYMEGTAQESPIKYIHVDEYADYRDIVTLNDQTVLNESVVREVKDLAQGCATLYNALVSNALFSYRHKVVFDLFANNLKFNFVINGEPSVADPMALIGGWVSFRFSFAHDNDPVQFLGIHQETLSRLEAVRK